MSDKGDIKTQTEFTEPSEVDRAIQLLSLEYTSLRNEMVAKMSGRYQFLGLMTTAAALLGSGIARPQFTSGRLIFSGLAIAVFLLGLVCFGVLGRHIIELSARAAEIEHRINALVPVSSGMPALVNWHSEHQQRTRLNQIMLGAVLPRKM
jgi:hypothetical protein